VPELKKETAGWRQIWATVAPPAEFSWKQFCFEQKVRSFCLQITDVFLLDSRQLAEKLKLTTCLKNSMF